MSLQGKTEEEIRGLEEALIGAVRARGGAAGNISLQRELQWPDDVYWPIRDLLFDSRVLRRYKARGGAVAIIPKEVTPATAGQQESSPEPAKPQAATPATKPEFTDEKELYPPILEVLKGAWSLDERFQHIIVENTSSQGSRNTGGIWTRPDMVAVAVRVLQFHPGKHLDVVTFEVKRWQAASVTSVYEALAHRRAATRSYVWIWCPEHSRDDFAESLDRITEEAERHGIGVVLATEPKDYETWEFITDARRVEPDPELLNDFITQQITSGGRSVIAAFVR